jgi:hypothetical protein
MKFVHVIKITRKSRSEKIYSQKRINTKALHFTKTILWTIANWKNMGKILIFCPDSLLIIVIC